MMIIVFVILICFNGLFVSSEGNYLPFLNPTDYSTVKYAENVSLPSQLKFGSSCYTNAWISTNGLISLGTRYTSYYPSLFPISIPVIAPYWDYNDLRYGGEVCYAVVTPTTDPSLCNQVNDYLSTSTGSSVSVEWILWAYWYDVYPYYYYRYNDYYSCNIESNHYQVVLAFQSNATYVVFIYKCGLIRWTDYRAGVGINSGDGYYINHPSSRVYNVTNIDCDGAVSGWSNVVYRLDQGYQSIDKFEFLSIITSHSITVSWELSMPDINSALILSVTDSRETVNETIIDVTGYTNYTYNDTRWGCFCSGVYTFKLMLAAKHRCNNENKTLSTEIGENSQPTNHSQPTNYSQPSDHSQPKNWLESSHNILIIGISGLSLFANLILLLAVVVLLKKKCRKTQSSTPHDPIVPVDIPVETEANSAYTQRRSNQIETSNEIQVSQNCSYGDATNVDEAIYDAIPQEIPPKPDTPHLYDDESAAQYEIPIPTVNQ